MTNISLRLRHEDVLKRCSLNLFSEIKLRVVRDFDLKAIKYTERKELEAILKERRLLERRERIEHDNVLKEGLSRGWESDDHPTTSSYLDEGSKIEEDDNLYTATLTIRRGDNVETIIHPTHVG